MRHKNHNIINTAYGFTFSPYIGYFNIFVQWLFIAAPSHNFLILLEFEPQK
jgi:hypothetical protein